MVSGARSVTAVTLPPGSPTRPGSTYRSGNAESSRTTRRDLGACLRRLGVIWAHSSRRLGVICAPLCAESALDGADRAAAAATAASRAARGLGLGEGAVGGTEAQGEGEGLLALADLRAGVDVEEPDATPAGLRRRRAAPRSTSAAGTDSSTTSATSSLASGLVGVRPARAGTSTRAAHQDVEVDLERRGAARQAVRPGRPAGGARRRGRSPRRRRSTRAHRLGCHGIRLGCLDSDVDAELGGQAADDLERVRPVGGAARRPTSPSASRSPPGPRPGTAVGRGSRRRACSSSASRGPPLHAVHRGRAAVDGERDGAGLEEGDAGGAAPEVAGGGVEDARAAAWSCRAASRPTAGWTGVRRGAARRRPAARARRRCRRRRTGS